jgi:beta-N-acetylhexosaminidase
MIKRSIVFIFFVMNAFQLLIAQSLLSEDAWVDSTIHAMTLDQKIGQLFIVRAFPKQDPLEINKINASIDSYHVGGLCYFQGSPEKQVDFTNSYQRRSKTPLFISIDGEWGMGMRFPESVMKFPKALTLGAISEDELIYDMGKEIAEHCKRMGIHFNFGPVVDINNNPDNPVINERSFGEDKFYVSQKATKYMQGLQDNGVIATAKHFPGHGDTNTDSHYSTPTIGHTKSHLENIELFPFKSLINSGIQSIMVGHLNVPALDNSPKICASLSTKIITNLLREDLGFNGLVITDAMEMKGVPKIVNGVRSEVVAFKAGVDILLMPESLPEAFRALKNEVINGSISPSRLDESLRRILKAKYSVNLHKFYPLNSSNLLNYLNGNNSVGIKTKLIQAALTLAKDERNALPFKQYFDKKFLSIAIGSSAENDFQKRISSYISCKHLQSKKDIILKDKTKMLALAEANDITIVSIHDMSRMPNKNYGISQSTIAFVNELSKKTNVILCIFGNPYAAKFFPNTPCIVECFEDDALFQDITAQSLFGVNSFNGRLPVTVSSDMPLGGGITKNSTGNLGYTVPEAVDVRSNILKEIDVITKEIVDVKAAPGGVVLIAKDNQIIWHKAFGNHTYFGQAVKESDVFDIASLTKVLSSTLAVMKLNENNQLDLNSPISQYINEAINTDKENIIIADMMAHHGRLIPFIPFYEETILKTKNKIFLPPKYYSTFKSSNFTLQINQNIFLHKSQVDTIWKRIYNSPLRDRNDYKYSDLGFYFVKQIVENISKQSLSDYVNKNIYKPLGLNNTLYNPLTKISMNRIPPTEEDRYWRGSTVQGYVHDMGAAMLGGVGGHAGLFSSSGDIAILFQTLLNGGSYGGNKIFEKSTIDKFTTRHHLSDRRGIGFDMKDLSNEKNMSSLASSSTYGHTGFTGICAYADPKEKLIYIFLSNRTYPNMNVNKLNQKEYREKIQDIIYRSLAPKTIRP